VIEVAKEERGLLERPPLIAGQCPDSLIDDRLTEGWVGAEIGELSGHKTPQGGIAIPEEGPEAGDAVGVARTGRESGRQVPLPCVGNGQ
jgi:hypothetical protein